MNVSLQRRVHRILPVLAAGTLAWLASAAPAQTPAPPPNVGSGDCDRACLQGLAEQFIAALIAHDPSKVRLAKAVRYSENSVPLPMPDGCLPTSPTAPGRTLTPAST